MMSKNGSKSEDFHNFCDNKGPTLTLIKTSKNHVFGGFTPLSWNCSGKNLNDTSNQTFIFSLNSLKSYNMKSTSKKAIQCFKGKGPTFGDSDIRVNENMTQGKSYANSCCNFLADKKLELIGSIGDSEEFNIDEIEIYKVIY